MGSQGDMKARNVKKEDLRRALNDLRDVRLRFTQAAGDPWAFRQALITVLILDERAALDHGVSKKDLDAFDVGARAYAVEWLNGRAGR